MCDGAGKFDGINDIYRFFMAKEVPTGLPEIQLIRELSAPAEQRLKKDGLEALDHMSLDMISTDLQGAGNALSEITGDAADERMLDEVFARFCVGK